MPASVNSRVQIFEHVEPWLRQVPSGLSFDRQVEWLHKNVPCHRQPSKLKWKKKSNTEDWLANNAKRDRSGRITGIHPYDQQLGQTSTTTTDKAAWPSFNDLVKWLKENLASSSGKIWVPQSHTIPERIWNQISPKDKAHLEAACNLISSLSKNATKKEVDFRHAILEKAGVRVSIDTKTGSRSERHTYVRFRDQDEDSAGYLLAAAVYQRLGVRDAEIEPYPSPEEFLMEFELFMMQPEQVLAKKVLDLKVEYDNERQKAIQDFTKERMEAYIADQWGRFKEYRGWCCENECSAEGCNVRDGRVIEGDHKKGKCDGGEKNGVPGEMTNPEFRKEKHLLQPLCGNDHRLKTKDDDDERGSSIKRSRRSIHYQLVSFVKEAYFKRCCSCGLTVTANTAKAFDLHHPFELRGCYSPSGALLVKQKLDAISALCEQINSFQEFKDKIFPELAIVALLCKNCHKLQTHFLEGSTIPNPFSTKTVSRDGRISKSYVATNDTVSLSFDFMHWIFFVFSIFCSLSCIPVYFHDTRWRQLWRTPTLLTVTLPTVAKESVAALLLVMAMQMLTGKLKTSSASMVNCSASSLIHPLPKWPRKSEDKEPGYRPVDSHWSSTENLRGLAGKTLVWNAPTLRDFSTKALMDPIVVTVW